MSLHSLLLEDNHKTQVEKVQQWVGDNAVRFTQLIEIVTGKDEHMARRAAWPMSYVAEAHPQLAIPHLPALIHLLRQPNIHNGITRNIVRLLQFVPIPESLHGDVMDRCFRYIEDLQEKPAIKAFALTVLHQLSQHYPEIVPEIKAIIADRLEYETPAFRVRAKIFFR